MFQNGTYALIGLFVRDTDNVICFELFLKWKKLLIFQLFPFWKHLVLLVFQ